MPTYIALLRGINVSGQKKIQMADLRSHFEDLGFQKVSTYIQSGNVVFTYPPTPARDLEEKISRKIEAEYGFEVPTLILTPQEIAGILENNPHLRDPGKDPDRLYFTLLAEEPATERVAAVNTADYHPEEFVLDGKTIYFYSPHGYGRAKMNNNFFENKLKVAATTRNLKTMQKLLEMAE